VQGSTQLSQKASKHCSSLPGPHAFLKNQNSTYYSSSFLQRLMQNPLHDLLHNQLDR
jgi:hypothetical protein